MRRAVHTSAQTTARDRARFAIRRVYDARGADGTCRVLVDRLWPRGLSKDDAALDEWDKDVAPSTELRQWYGHERSRFEQFARRYKQELSGSPAREAIAKLCAVARRTDVTLLTATRDVEHSGARVLRDVLIERTRARP